MDIGKIMASALATFGVLALVLLWSGAVDINWPWENIADNEAVLEQPEVATIVSVEPMTLDCRARITSSVPIEAKREHTIAGKVYRTDTVTMNAIGDIDTCVDSTEVEVRVDDDGITSVTVPSGAIRFERPRVDTVATLDSVHYDKGLLGKITDAFPWVEEDSTLTPGAYAYAQTVIGSGQCMREAYTVTEQAIIEAYRSQAAARGIDPATVRVEVVGEPDFDQHPPPTVLEGYEFTVDESTTQCQVDASALEPYVDPAAAVAG